MNEVNYQAVPGMDKGDDQGASAPLLLDYHDTSCLEDGHITSCDKETVLKDEYSRLKVVPLGKRLSLATLVKLRRLREVRTVLLLIFVFAVLFLVGLVVGLVVGLRHRYSSNDWRHRQPRPFVPLLPPRCSHPTMWAFDPEDRPPLEHFHHVAETSFELSASVDALFFAARGDAALAHGRIEIVDSETVSDVVIVNVTSYYNDVDNFLKFGRACVLRHGGTHGVEISTATHMQNRDKHHQIQWNVKVQLPKSSGGSPRAIRKLTTAMPYFSHEVGDIGQSVLFDTLTLRSVNTPVNIKSVTGKTVDVTTSNGHIEGSLNASHSLTLSTSNAPISVGIGMTNDKSWGFSNLKVFNSNAPIVTNMSLYSGRESGTGGVFIAHIRTSNSPLDVAVVDAPLDHSLAMNAITQNSPARVALHKTYEGAFTLSSPPFLLPTIEINQNVDDPAGRDRNRNVVVSKLTGGMAEGSVQWLPSDRTTRPGAVRLSTSNLGLDLSL